MEGVRLFEDIRFLSGTLQGTAGNFASEDGMIALQRSSCLMDSATRCVDELAAGTLLLTPRGHMNAGKRKTEGLATVLQ